MRNGIKIKCPKCNYNWIYTGRLLTAKCPSCRKDFNIKKVSKDEI
jgi:uncharacterized protein (DUF983 family)